MAFEIRMVKKGLSDIAQKLTLITMDVLDIKRPIIQKGLEQLKYLLTYSAIHKVVQFFKLHF